VAVAEKYDDLVDGPSPPLVAAAAASAASSLDSWQLACSQQLRSQSKATLKVAAASAAEDAKTEASTAIFSTCSRSLQLRARMDRVSQGSRTDDCTTGRYYPVYCMDMDRFLALPLMQKHEDVIAELYVPTRYNTMHFISHEWIGFSHPDPDGVQLKLMQDVLTAFAEGKAKSLFSTVDWPAFLQGFSAGTGETVRRFETQLIDRERFDEEDIRLHIIQGCVWLDYHSIPQSEERGQRSFLDAVDSIPHYVERCDYFWICAPDALHHDLHEPRNFASWRQRGWCRLEEMTNLMSKRLKMPLVVTSTSQVQTYGFLEWVQTMYGRPEKSVANGHFTCCRFNHKMECADGTLREILCDKVAIAPVIATVFDSLFSHSKGQADSFKRNLLQHAAPSIFAGLEELLPSKVAEFAAPPDETVAAFLLRAGYESLDSVDGLGWPPVMWAISFGHIKVVKEICQLRPDMLYQRPQQGQAIIAVAVHRPIEEFKEILSWDARSRTAKELNHPSFRGYTALDRAAKFGHHGAVRHLLELRADVDPKRLDNGCTPLLSAAEVGYPECCAALLEFRADIHAKSTAGDTALHLAARPTAVIGNYAAGAKTEVIAALLRGRADVHALDASGLTPLGVSKRLHFQEGATALHDMGAHLPRSK